MAKEFFPDGREAGLAIRIAKDSIGDSLQAGKECWLNGMGIQKLANILMGETKYTGNYMEAKTHEQGQEANTP